MAYTVKYTDNINKGEIIVEDRDVNNEDTSLSFPGTRYVGYGEIIAEDLLHMLENFAFTVPPDNPVEGQTWYDTTAGVDQLKIYDGTRWVPASGVFKAATVPEVSSAIAGDLWVDTDNQQLYLNSGAGWILVGPEFSQGSATGPRAAILAGTDNNNYTVLILDVNQIPVVILSGRQFTPKSTISGFSTIKPGVNLTTRILTDGPLKYRGVAESAETLRIGAENVASTSFLRADVNTTANGVLSVKNNQGIRIGDNNQLTIQAAGEVAKIRSNFGGAGIDLDVKQDGGYLSGISIRSQVNGELPKVGINRTNPQFELDVVGDLAVSGVVHANSTENTSGTGFGALRVSGGAYVAKDLIVDGNTTLGGALSLTGNITGEAATISGFNRVTANLFVGDVEGSVRGTLTGSASSATKLTSQTSFEIEGDVSAPAIQFNGAGDLTKVFNATISNEFIANKENTTVSQASDELIINRTAGAPGLYKISQRDLVKNIPQNPAGMVVQFAGPIPPRGWLLCDGSIIRKTDAGDLFGVIGFAFLDQIEILNRGFDDGYFALPDFRGRMPMGLDNMGGASANRVTDLGADILGNFGGKETTDVETRHLPEHEHDMRSSGANAKQYYAIRDIPADPANDSPEVTALNISTGTSAVSGIPTSGSVSGGGQSGIGDYRTVNGEPVGAALEVMNPYLAINYIIWTGGT